MTVWMPWFHVFMLLLDTVYVEYGSWPFHICQQLVPVQFIIFTELILYDLVTSQTKHQANATIIDCVLYVVSVTSPISEELLWCSECGDSGCRHLGIPPSTGSPLVQKKSKDVMYSKTSYRDQNDFLYQAVKVYFCRHFNMGSYGDCLVF